MLDPPNHMCITPVIKHQMESQPLSAPIPPGPQSTWLKQSRRWPQQHSPDPAGDLTPSLPSAGYLHLHLLLQRLRCSDLKQTLYIIELHYFFSQTEIKNKASLWVHQRNPGLFNIRILKMRLFTLPGKRQFYCSLKKAVNAIFKKLSVGVKTMREIISSAVN